MGRRADIFRQVHLIPNNQHQNLIIANYLDLL
jgi:hypothetical protein